MELKVTKTYEKFTDAFDSGKYRQVVMYGGSRSSKSYSILQRFMIELMTRKNIKITCWRDKKITCRKSIMEDFQNIILFNEQVHKDFKHNKLLGSFTYIPTGSKIIFDGSEDSGTVLGSAQNISFFNEVTEFKEEVFDEITQRTSEMVICDYNPRFDFWLNAYKHRDNTVFIHSTFLDNAYCPEEIAKEIKSREPWKTGSYEVVDGEIFYKGSPISSNNQPPPNVNNHKQKTVNIYRWLVYGLGIGSEKPTRIYKGWTKITQKLFDSFEYTSYFGLDFGTASPTACIEVKFDGDRDFYICERLYKPLGEINDTLTSVIEKDVPQAKIGKDLIICDNAKQLYIDLLRNYGYMAVRALKGQGSIVTGINAVQSFNINYVSSVNLEREYANYSWQLDRYGKAIDKPLATDDHLLDSLKYAIVYLIKYLSIKV